MMKPRQAKLHLAGSLFLFAMLATGGTAQAASLGCNYSGLKTQAIGGIGGTGHGSGIGGTGHGSGIGGTGKTVDLGKPAGSVLFSRGVVMAQLQGHTRKLVKGASVCVGETITTASNSVVQLKMADGGMLSVRPATKLRIEVFHFDGREDGTEKSRIALLQGGFRALTGLIGHTHKANYKITTPGAIIGIRGTDHEPMYIPTPAPGQKAIGVPGTYDKVNSGGVVITTARGSVDVRPNEIGFVPNTPDVAPRLLKEIPRIYQRGEGMHGGARGGETRGREGAGGEGRGGRDAGRRGESGRHHEFRTPDPRSEDYRSSHENVGGQEIPGSESDGEHD